MKPRTAAICIALFLVMYAGACVLAQAVWDQGCTWYVAKDAPVYTPGTANEIAVTLPAGTSCRVDESVGDTWQSIEYMLGGKTYTGMVRSEVLDRIP